MNKLISLIAKIFCNKTSVAQTANEHLTFKRVPLDGSLSEFVSKMKSAGFSYIGIQDGTAILKGDFAGFKGCMIGVSTVKNVDVVNTIYVIFPEKDDWSFLEETYQYLKNMLTEKYGKPSECVEDFQGYGSLSDNNDKLHRLKMDKCTFATVFETPKGDILLSLGHKNVNSCFVKLQYRDRINTDAVKAMAMDDL